jgi:Kef-type K+ transport system membrane component KefB
VDVVEVPRLVLSLAFVLAAAKAGGYLAGKARLPPVLGELGAGLLLGNLTLTGFSSLDYLKTDPGIDFAARIAVILLLFHASVESRSEKCGGWAGRRC